MSLDKWLPIETAPKDYEPCWYALEVRRKNGESWWEYYALYLDDEGELHEMSGDPFSTWALSDFTHWMPLADPPTAGVDPANNESCSPQIPVEANALERERALSDALAERLKPHVCQMKHCADTGHLKDKDALAQYTASRSNALGGRD